MRRAVLAIVSLGMLVAAGLVSAASAAPAQHRIFCPIFPDPTVQTVMHTVCTHTPH